MDRQEPAPTVTAWSSQLLHRGARDGTGIGPSRVVGRSSHSLGFRGLSLWSSSDCKHLSILTARAAVHITNAMAFPAPPGRWLAIWKVFKSLATFPDRYWIRTAVGKSPLHSLTSG